MMSFMEFVNWGLLSWGSRMQCTQEESLQLDSDKDGHPLMNEGSLRCME